MVCSLFSKQRPSRSLTWLVAVMAIAALMVGLLLSVAGCGEQQTATTNAASTTEVASTDTTIENTTTSAAAGAVDAALIGKWHSAQTSETLEFTSDGKMIITSDDKSLGANEFTYRVEGANVVYGLAGAAMFTSPYSIDGDVLTIVNPDVGGPVTCNRVK
jgi:hypothetical protein